MPLTFRIPDWLFPHYQKELQLYRAAIKQNNINQAWHHLERAHIICQSYAFPHTYVHAQMLILGIRTQNTKEISGQIIRIILGFIGSAIGKVPVGNTGGANVPMTQPMPIPADLSIVLQNPVSKT